MAMIHMQKTKLEKVRRLLMIISHSGLFLGGQAPKIYKCSLVLLHFIHY